MDGILRDAVLNFDHPEGKTALGIAKNLFAMLFVLGRGAAHDDRSRSIRHFLCIG